MTFQRGLAFLLLVSGLAIFGYLVFWYFGCECAAPDPSLPRPINWPQIAGYTAIGMIVVGLMLGFASLLPRRRQQAPAGEVGDAGDHRFGGMKPRTLVILLAGAALLGVVYGPLLMYWLREAL